MKRRRIVIVSLAVVLVLTAGIFVFMAVKKKSDEKRMAEGSSITQTERLTKRDISNTISLTGSIISGDLRSVSADLKDVEIREISVAEGDYVKAGDTIVVLDSDDLKEELASAKDSYTVSQAKENQTLKKAQDNVENAKSTYQSEAEKSAGSVSEAKSEYEAAEALKSDAKSTYEKAQNTASKAKEEYEKLKEKKDSLKKALEAAEKENREKSKALEEKKSAYETAEAAIKYAREEDENYETLYQAYTGAYSEYEAAEKEAESAAQAYEQAKKKYDAIEEARKKYEEAKNGEEQAKSVYESASSEVTKKSSQYSDAVKSQAETNAKNARNIEDSQADLSATGIEVENNLKTQKKQVQEVEEKLGECVITSPIDGVITGINVEERDNYTGESPLFVVQDTSQFMVEASVDEYDIADIEKGQEAVVKTDATGEEELAGTVSYVAPAPEESENSGMGSSSSTVSYKVWITLSEKSDRLRIGMTAKTSIVLESAKDVFAVAYDCIQTDREGNSYISVLEGERESQEEKQIFVDTGLESDYYVEISGEGLEENMRVLLPIAQVQQEEGDAREPGGNPFDGNLTDLPGGFEGGGPGGNGNGGMQGNPGGF